MEFCLKILDSEMNTKAVAKGTDEVSWTMPLDVHWSILQEMWSMSFRLGRNGSTCRQRLSMGTDIFFMSGWRGAMTSMCTVILR